MYFVQRGPRYTARYRQPRLVVRGKTGERDAVVRSVAAKRLDKFLAIRRAADPGGLLFVMPDGSSIVTLDVSCAPHPTEVVIVWTERGGPPVKAPSDQGGFGSKLINRAVAAQISREWISEGVVVALTVQKDRLSR